MQQVSHSPPLHLQHNVVNDEAAQVSSALVLQCHSATHRGPVPHNVGATVPHSGSNRAEPQSQPVMCLLLSFFLASMYTSFRSSKFKSFNEIK